MSVDDRLRKYVMRKIGRLDRYVPRQARASVHVEVKLKEDRAKDQQVCTCEVIVHLPQDTFALKETSPNMYTSVDIVEEKLKGHLKKYKDLHASPKIHRRLWARFWRSGA